MRFVLLLFVFMPSLCFSLDKHKLDSLNQVLVNAKEDTSKVNALLKLGDLFLSNDFKISEDYFNKAYIVSTSIEDKRSKAYALLGLGMVNMQRGNYDESTIQIKESIRVFREINKKKEVAKSLMIYGRLLYNIGDYTDAMAISKQAMAYLEKIDAKHDLAHAINDIANIYEGIGHYDKGIEYYAKSHDLFKQIDYKRGIAGTLLNIAIIDGKQGNHKQSLEKLKRSLKIFLKQGAKTDLSFTYNTMGFAYYDLKDYKNATLYFLKALELSKQIERRATLATSYEGLGLVSLDKENYNKALKDLQKCLELRRSIGGKVVVSEVLLLIAKAEFKLNRTNRTIQLCNESLVESKKENIIPNMMNAYLLLHQAYDYLEKYKISLGYYKLHIEMKESLRTEELEKQQMRITFDNEILEKDRLISIEKEKLGKKEIENKYTTRISALIIITLIAIIIITLINYLSNKKKNAIIKEKNSLLENINADLDRKNKKINESIEYASNIQKGYLPLTKDLEKHFEDIFIYYKPRDIVSGDFYWFIQKNDTMIIAVCDCTGHGVPGSMVSMLGNGLFNKIVNDMNVLNPGEILALLHKEFLSAFHQESGNSNTNGMDCSVLSINKKNQKIEFSGAVNPLYIIKDKELKIIKADIWSIGGGGLNRPNTKYTERKFNCHELSLDEKAQYFMFSDGFVDQFGGKNNRKFNKKRFDQLLIDISPLSAKEQKLQLDKKMEAWMKTSQNGQIDDMLVVGFRV